MKTTAVDRHLLAKEMVSLVVNSMIDLSDRERKEDQFVANRLDTMSYILSSAHDILEEFDEDFSDPGALIYSDYQH